MSFIITAFKERNRQKKSERESEECGERERARVIEERKRGKGGRGSGWERD